MDSDGKEVKGDASSESPGKSAFTIPEPVREDQVQNAVKFLSHPNVRGSPLIHRRVFLEKKGLTKEEIDEAFRRVPVRYVAYILVRFLFTYKIVVSEGCIVRYFLQM